jgi:hypothetical protein
MKWILIALALLAAWELFKPKSATSSPAVLPTDPFGPAAPPFDPSTWGKRPLKANVTLGEGTVIVSNPKDDCGPGCYYTTDPSDAEAP